MVDVHYLARVFNEKLAATSSFDAAFTKAVWVAYQLGYKDANEGTPQNNAGEAPHG